MLIIRVSHANKIVHVFIDQTERENIISRELVYLRVKTLWQFYEFKHGSYIRVRAVQGWAGRKQKGAKEN